MSLVLIADTPENAICLKRILQGHEFVAVSTMIEAAAKLQAQTFDLVIIGLHFDDSQMFELIREAKRILRNATSPIICFCGRDTELARIMHESLEVTTRLLGAWMYLNEHAYNVYKDPDAELRRVIERCLTEEARKEILQQRMDIQRQRTDIQQLRMMLQGQEWSPEMKQYLDGLRHDLTQLMQEVTKLQSFADTQRAMVESSRDLKDRVAEHVTSGENKMTQAETTQSLDETEQTTREEELYQKEAIKESAAQRKQDIDLLAKE